MIEARVANPHSSIQLALHAEEMDIEIPVIALSATCRRLRPFCLPHTFRSISLRCASTETWNDARQKLLTWNPVLSRYVREMSVLLPIWSSYQEPNTIPEDFPDKLLDMLETLSIASRKHLEKLTVIIDANKAHIFEAVFAARNPVFTHIRKLIVNPHNDYVAKYCPNVQVFSGTKHWHSSKTLPYFSTLHRNDHTFSLIEQAAGLAQLKCFQSPAWDSEELVTALQESLPLINTLVMAGGIGSFNNFVENVSFFEHLEVLSVPEVPDLHLGFQHEWREPDYMGPNVNEVVRQVRRDQHAVQERAASVIFEWGEEMEMVWSYNRDTGCPPWLTPDEWHTPTLNYAWLNAVPASTPFEWR
ncbi:hypothetical protein BDW22DRAFT_1257210 [Trametopsis cervina]|nr:hypothetical protein BDW22DRAFT_1257210 [Trametopsis cervina]